MSINPMMAWLKLTSVKHMQITEWACSISPTKHIQVVTHCCTSVAVSGCWRFAFHNRFAPCLLHTIKDMDILCLTLIFAIATKHINEATTLHSVASVSPLLSWPCCASFPTWSFLPIWYLLHFMLHPHSLPPHPSWSPPLPPTHLAAVVHLLFLLLLTTSR
jgi:hypothetical protein